MADLSIEELFPQTLGPQAVAAAQQPALVDVASQATTSEPEPVSQPSPASVSREEFDGLRQMLGLVLQSQQPRYQEQQPAAAPVDYSYKPKDFLTDEDATMILASQRPTGALNKAFNKVAQEVYTPLVGELQKRDQAIAAMYHHLQAREQQQQTQARAQSNQQVFFSQHPETKPFEYLVPYEAQIIAIEAQQNPAAFVGKAEKDIHSLLSQRVMARAKMIANAANTESQGDEGEPVRLPSASPAAPRTTLERGSGVRPGPTRVSKDPSRQALNEMSNWMRNGKRLAA